MGRETRKEGVKKNQKGAAARNPRKVSGAASQRSRADSRERQTRSRTGNRRLAHVRKEIGPQVSEAVTAPVGVRRSPVSDHTQMTRKKHLARVRLRDAANELSEEIWGHKWDHLSEVKGTPIGLWTEIP